MLRFPQAPQHFRRAVESLDPSLARPGERTVEVEIGDFNGPNLDDGLITSTRGGDKDTHATLTFSTNEASIFAILYHRLTTRALQENLGERGVVQERVAAVNMGRLNFLVDRLAKGTAGESPLIDTQNKLEGGGASFYKLILVERDLAGLPEHLRQYLLRR